MNLTGRICSAWLLSIPYCLLMVPLLATQFIYAHGTVVDPPSRVWNCYQENPENPQSQPCIDAVASHGTQPLYDWNEINQAQAAGNHQNYVPDGNLASGGRPGKYGGMDQVRSDWVSTPVSPGPFKVIWSNSAPHATEYYEVYITKDSWDPSQPLTWSSLTLLVRTPQSPAANYVEIDVVLPEREGRHVIYSVWQRSDSPEAFYSTSDVDFGENPVGIDDGEQLLEGFALEQNFPNPFNPTTVIKYQASANSALYLTIYDVTGRKVRTLINGQWTRGSGEAIWDGRNDAGQLVPSGTYLYRLRAGDKILVKTMKLIK